MPKVMVDKVIVNNNRGKREKLEIVYAQHPLN